MFKQQRVSVVIPALNEEQSITHVIHDLWKLKNADGQNIIDEIVVCDNGSTDKTAHVAFKAGAKLVFQKQRGYGKACQSAIAGLDPCDIVLFVDADDSCFIPQAIALLDAIVDGADLSIGSRTLGEIEEGALTPVQLFGNWLSAILIRLLWKHPISDLGPFRAIKSCVLTQLDMKDERYGWTVEMQVKAIQHKFVTIECAVDSKVRIGTSKISGTLKGAIGAGFGILGMITKLRVQQASYLAAHTTTVKTKDDTRFQTACQATLVIFCKRPLIYQGKQRLAATIGAKSAFSIAQALLDCALEDANAWPGQVVLTISNKEDVVWASSLLDRPHSVIVQNSGNLGLRINSIDKQLRALGHDRLVFIGTDAPMLTVKHYQQTCQALTIHDVVLSNAEDGGVVIMANCQPWPDLEALPWSTEYLGKTLKEACVQDNLDLVCISSGYDIDVEQDLLKLQRDLYNDPRSARQNLYQQINMFTEKHLEIEYAQVINK